jgi:hypothetical protein
MPEPEATVIIARCVYCNRKTLAWRNDEYPECEICFELALEAFRYLDSVEETLDLLTVESFRGTDAMK